MTTTQSTISFHNLVFSDDLPKLRDVEKRLRTFLKTTRERAESLELGAGRMEDEERSYPHDLVDEDDMCRIKRRAMRLLERMHSVTGMYHLTEENRVRLIPLKGGLPVAHIATEHEADEIAAALHEEMPRGWLQRPSLCLVWTERIGARRAAGAAIQSAGFSLAPWYRKKLLGAPRRTPSDGADDPY